MKLNAWRHKRFFVAVVVAAVAVVSTPIVAQGPQQLFQQAIARERADGALDEAIALYQRVVREAGADRPLVARALVRLAGLHERIGRRPEAKADYERVIREFADQAETVATARTRLAAIARADAPSVRTEAPERPTISEAPLFGSGLVSPDGEWIAIAGGPKRAARWLNGYRTYYVRHVRTGETREIETPTAPDALVTGYFAWSPDSSRVVFNRCNQPPLTCELVAANVSGKAQEIILPRQRGFFRPLAWTPDGRSIAVLFNGTSADPGANIGLVNVSDGAIREIHDVGRDEFRWFERPGDVAFSPDGRYLTFTSGDWNGPHDISLLPVDGGEVRQIIRHPDDDRFMAWTPAGNLLFLSNRSGAFDLWMVQVADGQATGPPVVLRRNIGLVQTHGLSARGALYYLSPAPRRLPGGGVDFSDIRNDVHLATLNPETGDIVAPPVPIAPDPPGRTHAPYWSADGQALLYRTRDDAAFLWTRLKVLSLATGVTREIRPAGIPSLGPAWLSRDGQSVIAVGVVPEGSSRVRRLYRVDVETGATSELIGPVTPNAELSADRRFVVDTRAAAPDRNMTAALVVRDLESRQDRVVYEAPKVQLNGIAISADDKQVAFREVAYGKARLLALSLADSRVREVTTLPTSVGGTQKTAWSPDGRFIYFVEKPNRTAEAEELWRVPSGGGSPQRVLSFPAAIWHLQIDPTGRYLSFGSQSHGWNRHEGPAPSQGASPGQIEHQWGRELVLEHFLPESELRPTPVRER
jgi:Tol biopolymer transport system component